MSQNFFLYLYLGIGSLIELKKTTHTITFKCISNDIYSKEITIVSTYAASDFDTKEALEKISKKAINVKQLITHKYQLDECQKAFEHARSGQNAMKIIINN